MRALDRLTVSVAYLHNLLQNPDTGSSRWCAAFITAHARMLKAAGKPILLTTRQKFPKFTNQKSNKHSPRKPRVRKPSFFREFEAAR